MLHQLVTLICQEVASAPSALLNVEHLNANLLKLLSYSSSRQHMLAINFINRPRVLTTGPFTRCCQTPKILARNVFLIARFGILWDFFGSATDSVCA